MLTVRSLSRLLDTSVVAIVVFAIAGIIPVIMPGVLSDVADAFEVDSSQTALLAAAEMAGTTLGCLAVCLGTHPFARRRLGWIVVALAGIGDLWAALSVSYQPLLVSRFIAGVGEGGMVALALASAAIAATPERLFALIIVVNMLLATAFFKFQIHLFALGGTPLIFSILLIFTLLAAVFLRRLGACAISTLGAGAAPMRLGPSFRLSDISATSMAALLAFLFFSMSIGVIWPLMSRIGASWQVDGARVGSSMGNATIVGLAAGLITAYVGLRFGRRVALWFGSGGLLLTMLGLEWPVAPEYFPALVVAFVFFWMSSLPYYLGLLAALDPSGRLAAFSMVVQSIGQTIGPAVAARTMRSDTYSVAIGEALAYCAIGLLLAVWAIKMVRAAEQPPLGGDN